jgi:hypothetical protein
LIHNPRLKWLAAGALSLLGVGLLVIPGNLIEEIARRAPLGQLPAIISVPQNEPILAAFDPTQYAEILRFGVKFSGVSLLIASGVVLLYWHLCNSSRLLGSTIRSYGRMAFLSSFFIAIAATCFYILLIWGFEGKWCQLESAVR